MRRRADTPLPYPGVACDDLTGTQRRSVQTAIVERYLGRLDRTEWARGYRRGPRFQGSARIERIYGTDRRRAPSHPVP